MPPRFVYWTIILEGKPTAFRAQNREDLLPTFKQLQAKHPDVALKWFARGKLWASPDEERSAGRGDRERRTGEWRPGGEHRDPRARFQVSRDEKRRRFAARQRRDDWTPRDRDRSPEAASRETPAPDKFPAGPGDNRPPWRSKPGLSKRRDDREHVRPSGDRDRKAGGRPPRREDTQGQQGPRGDRRPADRPWSGGRQPWRDKPGGVKRRDDRAPSEPRSSRPWSESERPRSDRGGPPRRDGAEGQQNRPARDDARQRNDRPWPGGNRPSGGSHGQRPWSDRPGKPQRDRPGPGPARPPGRHDQGFKPKGRGENPGGGRPDQRNRGGERRPADSRGRGGGRGGGGSRGRGGGPRGGGGSGQPR